VSSAIVSNTVLCLFLEPVCLFFDEGGVVGLKLFVVLPRQGKSTCC